jgi:hypothetical protein
VGPVTPGDGPASTAAVDGHLIATLQALGGCLDDLVGTAFGDAHLLVGDIESIRQRLMVIRRDAERLGKRIEQLKAAG